jgi:colicin import membrane protein
MTQEQNPIPLGEPEWDRSLWRMVAASGVLHVIAITLVIVIPYTFLHRPPALKSYTVDLIAPDHVGGTNMIAGGKGRVEGQPMAAAPKVEAPKPPPAPKVEQPKPPEPKPEPQKVEPPKPEPPKEVAKPEPKPQPAKPEPQPKENEAVLAEKVKKVEPPPVPQPAPQTKPAPPQAIAKAEPPKAESKAAAEAAKAAEKAAKEAAAARARDEKIEAAIKRVEQQMGKRGAGTGTKASEQPGAPISVGPGEGAGGTVRGVEYLLYYNQMINRIKQVWAWAGANRTLEATVRFNITENGEVVNVRITRPSGDPSYDASVERAVRAANPLPPPPETYRKEFSDVELIFRPEDLTG